jgi:hypothetical protein
MPPLFSKKEANIGSSAEITVDVVLTNKISGQSSGKKRFWFHVKRVIYMRICTVFRSLTSL